MAEIVIQIEVIIAIATPLVPLAIFIGRHFWKKEQCFAKMRDMLERLDKSNKKGIDEHTAFEGRITEFERRQEKNEIYLKQILRKLDITFD